MNTRWGITSPLYCLPLEDRLRHEKGVTLEVGSPFEIARRMRSRELDVGFVSPVEYARESSEYRIIPGFAVSSRGSVSLHFRHGLRSIRTMAADPSAASELVLAKIVLAEEYELSPAIVPALGPLEELLARADAALLIGDAALRESSGNPQSINLVELWGDLVGLPYVHGFFCAREEVPLSHIVMNLGVARSKPAWDLTRAVAHAGPRAAGLADGTLKAYLEQFTYEFTDQVRASLREYLQYAHWHGALNDIPDLNFYPFGPLDVGSDRAVSLN